MQTALRAFVLFLMAVVASASGAVALPNLVSRTQPLGQDFLTPAIVSVRGKVARVQVPAGYERIMIERRVASRSHPWAAFAAQACGPEGGEISINLPRRMPKWALRVTGRKAPVVPKLPGGTTPPPGGRLSVFFEPPDLWDGGPRTFYGSNDSALLSLSTGVAPASVETAPISREIVESDIWKLHGDRLYVFNPYRGLQALDLANPAEPVLLGTLSFPDGGEALYLLGDTHVALLTKREFTFTWNSQPLHNGGSLVICDVRAGKPEAVASLPIHGEIVESRLVGTALYIATAEYLSGDQTQSVRVTGYDLSDPAQPIERNNVVIPRPVGSSGGLFTVQASEAFFMVAQESRSPELNALSRYRSSVALVDISSPTGAVTLRGSVTCGGRVEDKFKMQERAGVLTVISNVVNARFTALENFDVSKPDAPVMLGRLALGKNETVRGTRFDGDRVYVVTFLQIDPLWIVDNSAPSAPAIVGHLEVPGFSTYLEPLGDRLVTIGLLNGQVIVSLFDVANPAAPKVLSQLPVTQTFAWSEATWNEKAFSVNPAAGLIMVPVQFAWSPWGGTVEGIGGIQLIDLEREHLKVRGRIDRDFVPRRSAFHRGTIVAIGDSTLLTADTVDRDHPKVLAEVQLAWRTDFAWPIGNYLIQVGAEIGGANPSITVSPASDPDAGLTTVQLEAGQILTADLRMDLYVVQQGPLPDVVPMVVGYVPPATYRLSIFNVASLPQVVPLGTVTLTGRGTRTSSVQLLWPDAGTAVLAATEQGSVYGGIRIIDPPKTIFLTPQNLVETTSASAPTSALGLIYWTPPSTGMSLIACNVTNPAAPAPLSWTFLDANSGNFSEIFAEAGKVFVTRQNGWGYVTFYTLADFAPQLPVSILPDLNGPGRHFLHVVDYANPSSPVSRPQVSAPGVLKGLTRGGTIVYTEGWQYNELGIGLGGTHALHVSVYDGQKLELATELPLPNFGRALTMGDRVFTFCNKATPETGGKLAAYAALLELQPDLQFAQQDEIRFGGYEERAVDGVLFTTNYLTSGASIRALDFTNPLDLRDLGSLGTPTLGQSMRRLTGDREHGFWVPAGDFGLLKLEPPSP